MINSKTDEAIEELFESLPYIYQMGLETTMQGSDYFWLCWFIALQVQ